MQATLFLLFLFLRNTRFLRIRDSRSCRSGLISRTILQVQLEDAAEADKIFSILMGDKVEPRRQFIEENARKVRNLDL